MLKRMKLTQSDLHIFQNKKVILYGNMYLCKQLLDIFTYYDINISAICLTSISRKFTLNYGYVPIISKKKLIRASKNNDEVMVQLAEYSKDLEIRSYDSIRKNMIKVSEIGAQAIIESFNPEMVFADIDSKIAVERNFKKWKKEVVRKSNFELISFKFLSKLKSHKTAVILCLPGKTADHTLLLTFNLINEARLKCSADINRYAFYIKRAFRYVLSKEDDLIFHVNVFHKPRYVEKQCYKNRHGKTKIITAVREPIAQNLSSFFQSLQDKTSIEDWIFGRIEDEMPRDREKITSDFKKLFLGKENDLQLWFNDFVNRYDYTEGVKCNNTYSARTIQHFMHQLKENIVDITKYPFDQEKGYTIIKEGNIEIFVYQLEKLNNLVPELSDFIGLPFDRLVRGNDASDKWIADSYKQAQKEIQISQEYFDKCFNEPYVQHCYSQADIEKFKEKWRVHIND